MVLPSPASVRGFCFWDGVCMDYAKLNGLVPAVVQDDDSNEVLMVGFMNADALEKTRATGYVTFYSRSRKTLWTKGETSGNRLRVVSLATDCDDDTVLARVVREGDGNVCHTGTRTCFTKTVALLPKGVAS
jgi:phosphoribosyl-AMP cyclohydrolase